MFVRLVKLLISACVRCVDSVSWGFGTLLGRRPARGVVLYYHAIRSDARQQFAAQMDQLLRLSVPVTLSSLGALAKGSRYSSVTFDDGFVSVVDNALPELRARNIPSTIFVPTGSIGRRPSWIDSAHSDGAEVVFTAAVMREIANQPLVEIASHSVSHPDFRRLSDQQAIEELTNSKGTIEGIIGRPVTAFSFPHGAHTQRSLDLAAQCGYTHVYTVEPLQLRDSQEPFSVGRVRVEPHDWPIEFHLKVLGAYRWMAPTSKIKRTLLNWLRPNRQQAAAQGT